MNEKELVERLQKDIQETVEFAAYLNASEKLLDLLTAHVPPEQHNYMMLLLQGYSEKSASVGKRMSELAQELADAE